MASVFQRGKNGVFQCSVYVGDKRVTGSLAVKDRCKAERAGGAVQKMVDGLTKTERRTQGQVIRYIGAILDELEIPPPWEMVAESVYFSEFARGWVDRKHKDGSQTVVNFAMAVIRDFEKQIGRKSMTAIKGQHVQDWYDGLVKQNFAPNTINLRLATLNSIFKNAFDMGTIRGNPAASIITVKSNSVVERKEFPDEIFAKVVAFLAHSALPDAPDWITAMMIARHAGLRLRDAVKVKQCDFDSNKNTLCFTVMKTGRTVCLPIFEPLAKYLREKKNADLHFCPRLSIQRASTLSMRFPAILELAGVTNEKKTLGSGRAFSQYTFHGLRHAFVSDLKRRGIPEHLSMVLADHTTRKAHDTYDHSKASDLASQLAPYFR